MIKLYRLFVGILFVLFNAAAWAQVDTTAVSITNVSCNGGRNGSITYSIAGGPGPVKYSWSNGVSGYATGNCTYAVVVNNPGAALTQFQIPVNVTIAAGMNADFSNIVFTDSAGNLFPFWLTDYPTATNARFWVRVPNIPAGQSVFYLSFCGSSTTSASNPYPVFEFFDSFDSTSASVYTDSCINIDQGGESCSYGVDSVTYFSPGYSLTLAANASCFSAPYDGAGSKADRVVTMINDSLVIDYEDKASVTLWGYCAGGTGTTNTVFADFVSVGNGASVGQGGSCATNTTGWQAETSNPFAVTTGTVTISLQTNGGDCDNSQGWFDDVRVRKYRYNAPTDTLLSTPPLTLDSLTAGTYTLTLTALNGSTTTRTITITQPAALQVTADSANNPCSGSGNGAVWAVVSGGVQPYALNWNTGQTSDTLTGLLPGAYSVTITDNNGCTAAANTNIAAVAPMHASINSDSVNCYGYSTGVAWVTVTGGQMPYNYLWSNAVATDTITGLPAGQYGVLVTDANACSTSTTVTITQPASAFTTTPGSSPVTCFGGSNGMAWGVSAGGTTPYHYLWNIGQTTDTITGLAAGNYTLTAVDNAGCADTVNGVVTAPASQLTVTLDSINEFCNGGNNGSATATVSGGTSPYTYLWSNNATGPSVSSLTASVYHVTATDAMQCTATASVNITQPPPLVVTVTSSSPQCAGYTTGSAAAAVTGGTPPYSYSWSTGASTDSATGLAAGAYSVTVTDSNHCQTVSNVSITPAEVISITQQQLTPVCPDSTNGAVTVSVAGGAMPYIYSWSNGATTQNLSSAGQGQYTLSVTDNLGCSVTFTATITVENFSVTISASPDSVIEFGDQVTLNVVGSNAVSAVWLPVVNFLDTGGLSVTTSPVTNTVYNVIATSSGDCKADASIKITVKPRPQWLVPTGFSPNGDGVNDFFHVTLRGPVEFVSLSVYDRWGQKVFESTSADPGWDGTFEERPQPVGVYVYMLQVRNLDNGQNSSQTITGNITLIR